MKMCNSKRVKFLFSNINRQWYFLIKCILIKINIDTKAHIQLLLIRGILTPHLAELVSNNGVKLSLRVLLTRGSHHSLSSIFSHFLVYNGGSEEK